MTSQPAWSKCGRLRLVCLLSLVSLTPLNCFIVPAARAQSSPATKQAVRPKAVWSETLETRYGLTRDEFTAIGFANLSMGQFGQLVTWLEQFQAKTKMEAQAWQTYYHCGRRSGASDPESYAKVKLLVIVGDQSPSEVASGLRQRIRSIPDAEIVFNEDGADLIVSVLTYENKTITGVHTGYTVSVVTSEPCKTQLGSISDYSETFSRMANHFLQTGSDLQEIIEGVVSELDANDIESQRKHGTSLRKLLQNHPGVKLGVDSWPTASK